MSEYIKNGDFSSGFNYWDNGCGGASYVLDAGKAKASSNEGDTDEVIYVIGQNFVLSHEVLSALLSVWGQWQNVNGNQVNGYTKFRVKIQKPDSSWYTPLALTEKDGSGSGWLLSDKDIKSELNQYGTYKLYLNCYVKSAKDINEEQESVSNDYQNWVNNSFTLYDSNSKVKKESPESRDVVSATIYKNFTIDGSSKDSKITVNAKGVYNTTGDEIGYCKLRVRLRKPNLSWVTLYEGNQSDGAWKNILNNEDITTHMSQSGTYRLELYTEVQSGRSWDGVLEEWIYYQSLGHFGDVSLVTKWDETVYTQSHGWYDNISLGIAIKKKKTVIEYVGSGEIPQKKSSAIRSAILKLGESYSTKTDKVFKTVSEGLQAVEAYVRKVAKTAKENLGVLESYIHSKLPTTKTVSEGASFLESLSAKKIAGNVETTFLITELTDWETASPQITRWIKTKTEFN